MYRGEVNEIYNKISDSIKIESKCNLCEFGEKSSKFFLTVEKIRATQNLVHIVLSNEQEITDLSEIRVQTKLENLEKRLFSENSGKTWKTRKKTEKSETKGAFLYDGENLFLEPSN